MKKIICALISVLLMGSVSFAQSNVAKAPQTQGPQQPKQHVVTGPATQQQASGVSKTTPKMKADGTPDMRHTANKKAAAAPAQKLKADGTPDMRYKANKKAAKTAPAAAKTGA